MAIREQDIVILESAIMRDVPEGGGGPSGNVVVDGASNNVFQDISETDRALGNVSIRKLHVGVRTDDTETLMGLHLTCTPPADPKVSATIFTDGSLFSRRAETVDRMEAYLFAGPFYNGNLLENHIRGMRAIQIFHHPGAEPPPAGRTLYIVQNEGKPNEFAQYVRVVRVSTELRQINIGVNMGDYTARITTLELSDPLASDFTGTALNITFTPSIGAARIRDTVVANAASYYGVSRIKEAVAAGDFSVRVDSIYTQLVPSSQTETPLIDYNPVGQSAAFVAAGAGAASFTASAPWSTTQDLAIGGPFLPGSLSISGGGSQFTDQTGKLLRDGASVGVVDYGSGVLKLLTGEVLGAKTVSYRPAVSPVLMSDSAMVPVTQETRGYNWSQSLPITPAPGSTTVSYMANGRWYTLTDDGTGTLRGADSAYGIGQLAEDTNTVSITAGALPDAGSAVLFTWGSAGRYTDTTAEAASMATRAELVFAAPVGCDPSTISMSWSQDDETLTVDGIVTTGVRQSRYDPLTGVYTLSLATLPAQGTTFSFTRTPRGTLRNISGGWQVDSSGLATMRIDGAFRVGSVRILMMLSGDEQSLFRNGYYDNPDTYVARFEDDGAGKIICRHTGQQAGTINYSTGDISIDTRVNAPFTYRAKTRTKFKFGEAMYETGVYPVVAPGRCLPADAGSISLSALVDEAGVSAMTTVISPRMTVTVPVGAATLESLRLNFSGASYETHNMVLYRRDASGNLVSNGSVSPGGEVSFATWPAGPSTVEIMAAMIRAGGSRHVDTVCFRVPVAPLRPGSLQIRARRDSGMITASAGVDGKITGPEVSGTIDVKTGVCMLRFGAMVLASTVVDELWYDVNSVVDGKIWRSNPIYPETLRYSATAYSYLPIDAATLGIDPVRLPQDGRAPIFRAGELLVLSSHQRVAETTVDNGRVIDCGRTRLSRVSVIGHDKAAINTGYVVDLDAGTVTFADVTGYSQPVSIDHWVEDLVQMVDVQIDGTIGLGAAVSHNYAIGDLACSALLLGNYFARVADSFDQESWDGRTWSNTINGNPASANYNQTIAPFVVTNRGAITERWALRFANSTQVDVIGENVGNLGRFPINAEIAPINPTANAPYFSVKAAGWGAGWNAGNTLFIRTIGAIAPFNIVRTVQKGAATVQDDRFCIVARANVDRP